MAREAWLFARNGGGIGSFQTPVVNPNNILLTLPAALAQLDWLYIYCISYQPGLLAGQPSGYACIYPSEYPIFESGRECDHHRGKRLVL